MDRNRRRWLALGLVFSTALASFALVATALSGFGGGTSGDLVVTTSAPMGLAVALAAITPFVVRWRLRSSALRGPRATHASTIAAASRA